MIVVQFFQEFIPLLFILFYCYYFPYYRGLSLKGNSLGVKFGFEINVSNVDYSIRGVTVLFKFHVK